MIAATTEGELVSPEGALEHIIFRSKWQKHPASDTSDQTIKKVHIAARDHFMWGNINEIHMENKANEET